MIIPHAWCFVAALKSVDKSNLRLHWKFVSFVSYASNNRWHLGHLLQVGNVYRWPRVNDRIFYLNKERNRKISKAMFFSRFICNPLDMLSTQEYLAIYHRLILRRVINFTRRQCDIFLCSGVWYRKPKKISNWKSNIKPHSHSVKTLRI